MDSPYERLKVRARNEVCKVCRSDLLVAFWTGQYALRCATCETYDGPTVPKLDPSLRQRYEAGEFLDPLERMVLHTALRRSLKRARDLGRVSAKTLALFRKLSNEMGVSAALDEEVTS